MKHRSLLSFFIAVVAVCFCVIFSISSSAKVVQNNDLRRADVELTYDVKVGDVLQLLYASELKPASEEDEQKLNDMLIYKIQKWSIYGNELYCNLYIKVPGTIQLIVTDQNEKGPVEHIITINSTLIGLDECSIKEPVDKVYTGKEQAQDISVTYENKDATFELQYSDTINPGEQYVEVTGTGNFTGTKRLYYHTVMPVPSFKNFAQSKNAIKVNLNPLQGVGYQLQVKKGSGTFQTIDLKTATSKLFSGLTFKDKYAFRTRAYAKVDGKNVFGAWSAVQNKVVGLSLNDCVITGVVNKVYNGKAQPQNVKVTYKGKPVKVDVAYSNSKAIGYRYVTVSGTGDFADSVRLYYYIVPPAPKITGLTDYYNESMDAIISQVKYSAVAGGVTGYQIAAQAKGTDKWTYFTTTGLSRNMKLPEDKIYTIVVRAYKAFDNGVTVYGKWSAAERVFPTNQWIFTNPIYFTQDTLSGYVTKALKGDKLIFSVKGKTYTVTVGKDSKQFNFKVKVGKFSAGTTIAVKYCTKFNQVKLSGVTPVYYAEDLQKGFTAAQVKLVPNFEQPDRVSKKNGNVIWEYAWQVSQTKGIYGVLTFKDGKLVNWEYYDVDL